MEDEFQMKVTEVYAEPASQKDEKLMGGLKMSWNTEEGRLFCRWVDSPKDEKRDLSNPNVPASHTLTGFRLRAASANESARDTRSSRSDMRAQTV